MTRRQKEVFLEAFALVGNICDAARSAGITREAHYRWMKSDAKYPARFEDAAEKSVAALEREARRRAIVGTEEPVFQGGKEVGHIRRFSDPLLIFLLKGERPAKYRERFEHSGPDGKPLVVTVYVPDNHRP